MKNNKRIKNRLSFKILAALLIFISVLNILPVFANENIGEITIVQESYDPLVLKRGDEDQGCPNVIGKRDGKDFPAYCINMERPGVGSVGIFSQVVTLQNRHIDDAVYRAVINGHPYKTPQELGVENEKEAYYATKFAVWAMQNNLGLDYYTSNGSPKSTRVHNAYKQIITNAKKDTRTFNNITAKIEGIENDWKVVNNNILEREYIIKGTRDGDVDLKVSGVKSVQMLDMNNNPKSSFKIGDKFKLRVDIKDLEKLNKIVIDGTASLKTFPVIYAKTHDEKLQNYAYTGSVSSANIQMKHEISLTNETKIKILKLDGELGKSLEGVEFRVISKEHNLNKVFKTNADGEIILDNILPGKYIVKEEKALNGYAKLDEEINIDLKFNEESTLIIRNNKISFEKNETSQNVISKESFKPGESKIDYKVTEKVKEKNTPTVEHRKTIEGDEKETKKEINKEIVKGEKTETKEKVRKIEYTVLPKTGY